MTYFQATILTASSPYSHVDNQTVDGAGLAVSIRDQLGLATVLSRKACREALKQSLLDHFQIELPAGPRYTRADNIALIGTGPDAWLSIQEHSANAFAVSLREKIGELASVSDQSDGYAVLRLSGLKVRETLAKLIPIDLHPRAFRVGDVASTLAAHIGATLWRLDDDRNDYAVFEIAIYRSYTASFWRALSESAAEFRPNLTKEPPNQIR